MRWIYKLRLIVPMAVLVGVACFATFGIRTTRLETLQKTVGENIKSGEPPEKVIRFLMQRNLNPSNLFQPQVMQISGHDYAEQKIVVAVKRYSVRALLWKETIYPRFCV